MTTVCFTALDGLQQLATRVALVIFLHSPRVFPLRANPLLDFAMETWLRASLRYGVRWLTLNGVCPKCFALGRMGLCPQTPSPLGGLFSLG